MVLLAIVLPLPATLTDDRGSVIHRIAPSSPLRMQTAAAPPFGELHPLLEGCAALLERGSRLDVRIATLVKAASFLSDSATTSSSSIDLPFAVDSRSREEIQSKLVAAIADSRPSGSGWVHPSSLAHHVLQRRTTTPSTAVAAPQQQLQQLEEAVMQSDRSVSSSSSSSSSASSSTTAPSCPPHDGRKVPGEHVEFLLRQMRAAVTNATPSHVAPECVMTEVRRFLQPPPTSPSSTIAVPHADVREGAPVGQATSDEDAPQGRDEEKSDASIGARTSGSQPPQATPPQAAPPPPRPGQLPPPPPPVARPSALPPPPRPPVSAPLSAKQVDVETIAAAATQQVSSSKGDETSQSRPANSVATAAEREALPIDWEQAAADALASGTWKAVQDAKQRTYYVNKAEKKSCWNLAKELQRRAAEVN